MRLRSAGLAALALILTTVLVGASEGTRDAQETQSIGPATAQSLEVRTLFESAWFRSERDNKREHLQLAVALRNIGDVPALFNTAGLVNGESLENPVELQRLGQYEGPILGEWQKVRSGQ